MVRPRVSRDASRGVKLQGKRCRVDINRAHILLRAPVSLLNPAASSVARTFEPLGAGLVRSRTMMSLSAARAPSLGRTNGLHRRAAQAALRGARLRPASLGPARGDVVADGPERAASPAGFDQRDGPAAASRGASEGERGAGAAAPPAPEGARARGRTTPGIWLPMLDHYALLGLPLRAGPHAIRRSAEQLLRASPAHAGYSQVRARPGRACPLANAGVAAACTQPRTPPARVEPARPTYSRHP